MLSIILHLFYARAYILLAKVANTAARLLHASPISHDKITESEGKIMSCYPKNVDVV